MKSEGCHLKNKTSLGRDTEKCTAEFHELVDGTEKPHLKTDQQVAQVSRQNQGCGPRSQLLSSNPAPRGCCIIGMDRSGCPKITGTTMSGCACESVFGRLALA